ncbi:MAG: FAD-dependent monooxygenase [Gammaproteobacteria bacterium]|nr:FAD-dependent monooxygenase [Gammaproteobacteria bacterium]
MTRIETGQKVIIVGGGIAGLSTALALNHVGICSSVFEKYSFSDRFGAGIQLTPNATNILFKFGLEQSLRATSIEVSDMYIRHWKTDRKLTTIDLRSTIAKHCSSPYLQIRRAHLIQILSEACRQYTNIELFPDEELNSIKSSFDGVSVSSEKRTLTGPLAVGADGTHSKTREMMRIPHEYQFTGWHAWRTTVKTHSEKDLSMNVWCGSDGHVIAYPISNLGHLNLVFISKSNEEFENRWRQTGDLVELREYFSSWCLQIQKFIDLIEAKQLFKWGLFSSKLQKSNWHRERVVLLGDAVHPILPFLAQGAAIAIEDAMSLARVLNSYRNHADAIQLFVQSRHKRVKMIQDNSEKMGLVYHMHEPLAKLRDFYTKFAITQLIRSIYAYDTYKIKG